jgi:hypothetical protein
MTLAEAEAIATQFVRLHAVIESRLARGAADRRTGTSERRAAWRQKTTAAILDAICDSCQCFNSGVDRIGTADILDVLNALVRQFRQH